MVSLRETFVVGCSKVLEVAQPDFAHTVPLDLALGI